jgi:hypothetical protein
MKWLASVMPFLGFLFLSGPGVAQDEATIKGAFIMCGQQRVLTACVDLVEMPIPGARSCGNIGPHCCS